MNFNQILSWAAPDQFPIKFNWNLNEMQADALLGCPRSISYQFQLKFIWNSIRFSPGLPQINFLLNSVKKLSEIQSVRHSRCQNSCVFTGCLTCSMIFYVFICVFSGVLGHLLIFSGFYMCFLRFPRFFIVFPQLLPNS